METSESIFRDREVNDVHASVGEIRGKCPKFV